MVRKIFCLSLALMLVAFAVPAMASTSVWVETPAADGAVNLRSGPGTEYPVIGWAVYGDELVLLSAGNQWYQVQIVKNGKIGFMSKEYISFDKPSSTPSTGTTAWISTKTANGSVNIRTGPGTGYGVIGWALNGDKLEVLSRGTSWHYVKLVKNGKIGYVSASYVSFTQGGSGSGGGSGSSSATSGSGRVVTKYASSNVNVRASASSSSGVLTSLKNGTTVTILGRTGDWYKIRTSGGTVGYMYKDYIAAGTAAVTTGDVNMRSGPGTSYARLRVIPKGTQIEVLEKGSSFSKVLYGNYTGYISNRYFRNA